VTTADYFYSVPYGMQLSISIHDLVERNIHVTGSLMGGPSISLEVMRYICNDQILPMTSFVSLEEIPEQLELIVEGKTFGKVIAKIQEPIDASFMKQR
jgi:alcohol dehydrogenase, propanol-preferring